MTTTHDGHAYFSVCRVSTFVLATEDPSQALRIIGATSDLRTPAYYDKGVRFTSCMREFFCAQVVFSCSSLATIQQDDVVLKTFMVQLLEFIKTRILAAFHTNLGSQLLTPGCAYCVQVNQQFPQGDSLAQQHAIRLLQDGQRKEQPLQTAMGNSYPLIIRLEALTEQAAAQGKELQQVGIHCSCG